MESEGAQDQATKAVGSSGCYLGMGFFQFATAVTILFCLRSDFQEVAVFIQIWALLFIILHLALIYLTKHSNFCYDNLPEMLIILMLSGCLVLSTTKSTLGFQVCSALGSSLVIVRSCLQLFKLLQSRLLPATSQNCQQISQIKFGESLF